MSEIKDLFTLALFLLALFILLDIFRAIVMWYEFWKPFKEAQLDRTIPYDEKVMCENCGKEGSFDFMGDDLCGDCYQIMENGKQHCFYEEPYTFWELARLFIDGTITSLVTLFRKRK